MIKDNPTSLGYWGNPSLSKKISTKGRALKQVIKLQKLQKEAENEKEQLDTLTKQNRIIKEAYNYYRYADWKTFIYKQNGSNSYRDIVYGYNQIPSGAQSTIQVGYISTGESYKDTIRIISYDKKCIWNGDTDEVTFYQLDDVNTGETKSYTYHIGDTLNVPVAYGQNYNKNVQFFIKYGQLVFMKESDYQKLIK